MVVAAVVGFREGALRVDGASKFAAEDHEGVVQHTALFQVLDQGVTSLIHVLALHGEVVGQVAMLVPPAMENLHEAHSPLHQTAGHQRTVGEGAAVLRFLAIEFEGLVAFAAQISQVGDTGLHTEGHFILLGAGLDFRVTDQFISGLIQGGETVEHFTAELAGNARSVLQKKHRVALGPQGNARVFARKKTSPPEPGRNGLHIGAGIRMRGMQHHKRGQVLIHRAKAPRQPGPHGRLAADHAARIHQLIRRFVVDGVGFHGADDAQVIHHLRRPWQGFTEPRAGLAVLGEFEDRGRDRKGSLSGRHPCESFALRRQVILEVLFEGGLQVGLVVEKIKLGGRSDQGDVNGTFGFGREVGAGREILSRAAALTQQRSQGGRPQAHGVAAEKLAAADRAIPRFDGWQAGRMMDHVREGKRLLGQGFVHVQHLADGEGP